MKIAASKVRISCRYIVDCDVCGVGVEVEISESSSGFITREEAAEAKRSHLEEHARDEL